MVFRLALLPLQKEYYGFQIAPFDFVKGALWFLRLPLLPCFNVYILKPQNRNQQNRLINQELF